MKKKKYWKDVLHAFTISFGRTLSIVFLLALGAMALTGLKVTGPNMQNTAQEYASKTKMADFYVTSDYGLTKTEKAELNKIKGVQVELANLTDVTIKHTNSAVRIFSVPKKMSLCTLISGRMPKNDAEIVLGPSLQKKYRVGDKIVFSKDKAKFLRKNAYTVVGFAKSADIWDNSTMGSSS
ncbi:MAG: peptide ABC transporter permease, partial [Ligilactobacillus ruminis]|nr:peptide ABC transporter permease [Ligilactobacillus ruminis]